MLAHPLLVDSLDVRLGLGQRFRSVADITRVGGKHATIETGWLAPRQKRYLATAEITAIPK